MSKDRHQGQLREQQLDRLVNRLKGYKLRAAHEVCSLAGQLTDSNESGYLRGRDFSSSSGLTSEEMYRDQFHIPQMSKRARSMFPERVSSRASCPVCPPPWPCRMVTIERAPLNYY